MPPTPPRFPWCRASRHFQIETRYLVSYGGWAMKDYRDRAYSLPRLPRPYYQADAMVHWTLTVFDRATCWLTERFHARFRELLLHTAAREGLFCPVYCLMPDHLHLVWLGLRPDTDQLNGMAFLRTHLEPELAPAKFQPQATTMCSGKRNANATLSSPVSPTT